MRRETKPGPAAIAARMPPLPHSHRIAHLRALIRREPVGSVRGEQLAALLRDQTAARPARKSRNV